MEISGISLRELEVALLRKKTRTNKTSVTVNGFTVRDLRPIGSRLWFEYHCWESYQSADASLWLRSHQQVRVVGFAECEPPAFTTLRQRGENGHQLLYRVKFDDDAEYDVFEDELLDSQSEFERPDPPSEKENASKLPQED